MTDTQKVNDFIARAGEQLFQYAIDRGDMKSILDALPLELPEKRVALENEIQLLRIVSVGWAIAFFLADNELKTPVSESYWENMRAFSATLSTSASLTVGSGINYFDTLKQRLNDYVGAMDAAGQIPDPAMAIGPAFARAYGDAEDACAVLAGSKMFTHTIHAVREYLDVALPGQDDRRDRL